jgi:hypothetical protein
MKFGTWSVGINLIPLTLLKRVLLSHLIFAYICQQHFRRSLQVLLLEHRSHFLGRPVGEDSVDVRVIGRRRGAHLVRAEGWSKVERRLQQHRRHGQEGEAGTGK